MTNNNNNMDIRKCNKNNNINVINVKILISLLYYTKLTLYYNTTWEHKEHREHTGTQRTHVNT